MLISLLKPDPENPDGRYKPYQLYLGRLGTFVTIGLFQALCITLGDFYILEAYVADKVPFVLFAMLVSMVFVTITYTLLSVFGNVGKGIAIIFMVFQFSSSGGTFPISMTAPFSRHSIRLCRSPTRSVCCVKGSGASSGRRRFGIFSCCAASSASVCLLRWP